MFKYVESIGGAGILHNYFLFIYTLVDFKFDFFMEFMLVLEFLGFEV
jgi:hypothetical protein